MRSETSRNEGPGPAALAAALFLVQLLAGPVLSAVSSGDAGPLLWFLAALSLVGGSLGTYALYRYANPAPSPATLAPSPGEQPDVNSEPSELPRRLPTVPRSTLGKRPDIDDASSDLPRQLTISPRVRAPQAVTRASARFGVVGPIFGVLAIATVVFLRAAPDAVPLEYLLTGRPPSPRWEHVVEVARRSVPVALVLCPVVLAVALTMGEVLFRAGRQVPATAIVAFGVLATVLLARQASDAIERRVDDDYGEFAALVRARAPATTGYASIAFDGDIGHADVSRVDDNPLRVLCWNDLYTIVIVESAAPLDALTLCDAEDLENPSAGEAALLRLTDDGYSELWRRPGWSFALYGDQVALVYPEGVYQESGTEVIHVDVVDRDGAVLAAASVTIDAAQSDVDFLGVGGDGPAASEADIALRERWASLRPEVALPPAGTRAVLVACGFQSGAAILEVPSGRFLRNDCTSAG